MPVIQYPRLADPSDIPRLITDDRVTWQWPPPGTTVQVLAFPELWVLVRGTPSEGAPGDWYVGTLAQLALELNETVEQVATRFASLFTGPVAAFAGTLGNWPVIYEVGKVNAMRWIKSTIRGTLGTVEQFQFQMCFGNPGNDPDYGEADCLAFSTDLRNEIGVQWIRQNHGQLMRGAFSPDVKLVEVGTVTETITSAVNADGSGGNLEQPFMTQWAAWPVNSQPVGGGLGQLPYEVACAITLQTDHRGPSGRGRFYLPTFAASTMTAGGRFDANYTTDQAMHWGEIMATVGTLHSLKPIVVSKRRLILNEVTSVNAGSVPDSQRRRRRSQPEARVTGWTKP